MFLFKWQTLFRISDAGISVLFLFLAKFISLILTFRNKTMEELTSMLPRSTPATKKLLGLH